MRTTIRLDETVLRRAKAAAAARGTSLNALIEDAIRAALAPRPAAARAAERPRPVIPTFKGRGTHAGVDLDDSSALADLMDDLA
jgi:hypothetical protein